jgi:hypothetical protein
MSAKYRLGFSTTLIAICLLQLSGCSTRREVVGRMDRAPADLRVQCEAMALLKEPVSLGDLTEADGQLANQYRECSAKVKRWIEWEAKPPQAIIN